MRKRIRNFLKKSLKKLFRIALLNFEDSWKIFLKNILKRFWNYLWKIFCRNLYGSFLRKPQKNCTGKFRKTSGKKNFSQQIPGKFPENLGEISTELSGCLVLEELLYIFLFLLKIPKKCEPIPGENFRKMPVI